MSEVVRLARQPVAAIIVCRSSVGPQPFLVVPRSRSMLGKPSAAIDRSWAASSFDSAINIAKWLSKRCGLPVLIDPAARVSAPEQSR